MYNTITYRYIYGMMFVRFMTHFCYKLLPNLHVVTVGGPSHCAGPRPSGPGILKFYSQNSV